MTKGERLIEELKKLYREAPEHGARGKMLRPYKVSDLNTVERWIADNEILDPEGPDELFEPPEQHGLFRARTGLLNKLMKR